MIAVAVPLLFAAAAPTPRAAPFGIPKGTQIARLRVLSRYGSKYYVVQPPVRNSMFERYSVTATPVHGVCGIRATAPAVEDFETAARQLKEVAKVLSVYGKAELGMLPEGLPLMDADLRRMDDYRDRVWDRNLPNNLRSITVGIWGKEGSYDVTVSYFYNNMPACANWEPGQDTKGL